MLGSSAFDCEPITHETVRLGKIPPILEGVTFGSIPKLCSTTCKCHMNGLYATHAWKVFLETLHSSFIPKLLCL